MNNAGLSSSSSTNKRNLSDLKHSLSTMNGTARRHLTPPFRSVVAVEFSREKLYQFSIALGQKKKL